MPYIYAIADVDNTNKPVQEGIYYPCSKETAETHELGRWKLESHTGKNMTGWLRFWEQAPKSGKGKPLADATGQPLAAGDFVMTTINKYADLVLCEVMEFTPQKIRIRDLKSPHTILKTPEDIIKVDKNIFF